MRRIERGALTGLFALLACLLLACSARAAEAQPRLIIVGFDGMDPNLVDQYMAQGHLPNLQALAQRGAYSRLDTTNPAQSPVAWSCFSVGANPGYTNIFDFLNRIPGTYFPEFAMTKAAPQPVPKAKLQYGLAGLCLLLGLIAAGLALRRGRSGKRRIKPALALLTLLGAMPAIVGWVLIAAWVPQQLPAPQCGREGEPFWVTTDKAGVPSVALRMPAAFPAEQMGENGRMLAGLGVPDVRQTNGTFSIYSTEQFDQMDTELGGKLITVRPSAGRFAAPIFGPGDPTSPLAQKPDLTAALEGEINEARDSALITIQDQHFELKPGQWSDWVRISFSPNPLIKIHGIARLCLLEVSPTFRLYLSPINFDPSALPATVKYSYPEEFAGQLAEQVGLYKTLGWAEDTWALNEERIGEKQFIEDVLFSFEEDKRIFWSQFERDDWRLLILPFMCTDRVGHMFWRFLDPKSPAYDAELAPQWGDAIERVYVEVDGFVGQVLERMQPDDVLLVLSDHGFQPFNKAVNINTWLARNGFLALLSPDKVRDRNLDDLFGQGEFWPNVDWSESRAYALGLGMIFLNMAGREPQGIVRPEDYERLQDEIVAGLTQLIDPETGGRVVRNVYRRQEVYSGPYYENAPDLLVGFMPGYRVSWQTALGGIPKDVLEVNARKWSGDHCSFDPPITQGIFFSSLPIDYDTVHIYDFAPTALKFFGVEIPAYMEGKSLLANSR